MIAALRDISIKNKMMAIMLSICCVVLFFTFAVYLVSESFFFWNQERERISVLAEVIGANAAAPLLFNDREAATETLSSLRKEKHVISAFILTPDGEIFAEHIGTYGDHHRWDGSPKDVKLLLGEAEQAKFWDFDGDLEVAAPIIVDEQRVGTILLRADLHELQERVTRMVAVMAVVFLSSVLLAYLMSSRLQRLISFPILRLAEAMKKVTENKDYAVRVEKKGNDEIGHLMDGFNRMLGEIQSRDRRLEETNALIQRELAAKERAEEEMRLLNLKISATNNELLEMNEEIKNFAYIVSHDLRAPLVSIKGFSSELQSTIKELQPLIEQSARHLGEKERKKVDLLLHEDVKESLEFIHSSVNRMDGQINAILNLSRLGKKELKPEPVPIGPVVQGILYSLAHQIEKLRVTVEIGELPTITADRMAMEQIFGNLLDNALKYLEPGREGALSVTAERRSGETLFCVRDNGRGIAQEDMHKVFELFRRAGKQDTKGEGMGLAYVKTLVRRHGGRIWCESDFGAGTVFSFTIADGGPGVQGGTK